MPNSTFDPYQTVLPGGIPNDYQHIDVSPDMFGARSAEAAQKAGSDIVSAGERVTNSLIARQDLYNTLTANDMNTQGVAALSKIQDDFSQKTGKDAYDSYPQAQQQVLDAVNGILEKSPNLKTKVALSTSLKYYSDRITMSMRSYADSQLHDYTKQSYTDSAGVKADSFAAIYDKDPSAADALLQSGIDDFTHVAQLSGLDGDFEAHKYVGAVVGKAIQDQIAGGQISGAERLFQTYRDKMDMASQLAADKAFKGIHAVNDAQDAAYGRLDATAPQGPITSQDDIRDYIVKAAKDRGIDPATALKVWGAEGQTASPDNNWHAFDPNEESYGPFQLNVGTFGSRVKGMTAQQNIDTALDYAVKNGWDAWSSKTKTGITGMTGIGPGARQGGSPFQIKGDIAGAAPPAASALQKLQQSLPFQVSVLRGASANLGGNHSFEGGRSDHDKGLAFDIDTTGMTDAQKIQTLNAAKLAGFTDFGLGPKDMHVGMSGSARAWTYGGSGTPGIGGSNSITPGETWGGVSLTDLQKDIVSNPKAPLALDGVVRSPAESVLVPQAQAQKALNAKYADDPEALLTASRKLDDIYTNLRTTNKAEIDQLTTNVPTMISSLSAGNMEFADQVDEAIQKIQTYQPPHAEQMIQDLQISRRVGTAISGLKWESPEQLAAVNDDLTSSRGQISDFIAQNITDPEEHAKLVTAAQKGLQSFIDQRTKELATDPAKYVASHPSVSAAWDAYTAAVKQNPSAAPAAFASAANISLTVQASLGVERPHIFDARTAQQFTDQIVTGADPGKVMDKIQASTGSAWPNVFQDIVALGKLPADYAMMQTLDPKNKGLMSQALKEQKSSPDKTWDIRLGKDPQEPTRLLAVKIRDNVDDSLAPFVNTLKASQASGDQIDQIVHGVQTLAFAKSYYDNDPTAALDAVKAYTSQYDLGFSKARIPVAAAPVVKQNANNLLTHLPDWNITYPDNIGQPGQPTRADFASWARSNPTWVTAPSGDRMWLVLPDGTRLKGPDGQPLGVMFTGKAYSADITPNASVSSAAPASEADQVRAQIEKNAREGLLKSGIPADKIDKAVDDYMRHIDENGARTTPLMSPRQQHGSLLPSDFHSRPLGDRLNALETMLG